MKKFAKWLLIASVAAIALVFLVRVINPEFAAEMDKRADSTRVADSARKVMQAQMQAEQASAAQAAEQERSAKLLGISAKEALAGFSEIEGVEISSGKLKTGEPRTMAQFKSFLVECIGDEGNISKATIMVMNDGNTQTAQLNAVALSRFVKNTLNSDDIDPFVKALKIDKSSFQINSRTVEVSTADMGGVKATTFTVSK